MSAEHDRARAIAERIAQRVSQSEGRDESTARGARTETDDDMAAVRQSIAELKRKLSAIEENLSHNKDEDSFGLRGARERDESSASGRERSASARPPSSAHSPWLSGIYVPAAHPSLEKFGVEEAAVSELVDFFEKEKVCELEPGGKPCTHCDMCNTRGF
jgi:hypothetical protein